MSNDLRVLACNYREGRSAIRTGALAYVVGGFNGDGMGRREVLVRSRSGRHMVKWEDMNRLQNFRFKVVPPEHPCYSMLKASTAVNIAEREGQAFIDRGLAL